MSDADRLRAHGLDVETVGDILENGTGGSNAPRTPFVPARLGSAPDLPEPGIYFGMTDEQYHALPALSASGVKLMAASTMLYWAKMSWLNPEKEEQVAEAEKDKDHLPIGKAYHCRILEGADEFARRYIAEPEKPDFGEGVIEGSDAIKNRIREIGATMDPVVKPQGTITDAQGNKRQAVKADWIAQLQGLDPNAKIMEVLKEAFDREFDAQHKGKVRLPAKIVRRIEIAAAMIEKDPGISPHMQGGYPEVTLIAIDPQTGVPLKARVDKMKVTKKLDLKTIANQRERSMREACRWEIAGYKYLVQPVFYDYVSELVRGLVREHGASVVHSWDIDHPGFVESQSDRVAFALKWASHRKGDDFGWIFQQKGMAPVSRLFWAPRQGIKRTIVEDMIGRQIALFRQYSETFGVEPWLDLADPEQFADEDLPESAVEI